jgi:hypothetical protein
LAVNAFGARIRPAYVPLRHYHRKLGAGFVALPQMTGRRFGMPFILSPPTLTLMWTPSCQQQNTKTYYEIMRAYVRALN